MDEETLKQIAAQLRKPEGDTGREVGERMNSGNELINRSAIAALSVQPNDSILEIGMGNGFFVKDILQTQQVQYSGCDYSSTMVDEAGKLNKEFVTAGRAAFYLTAASTLPFKDNTFTKAFTVNTIYFWENPNHELSEIKRVLQPGGLLVIGIRPGHSMRHYPFTKYGFRFFEADEVATRLTENGFNVVDTIHQQEPAQEISGQTFVPETVLVCAKKNE